MIYILVNLPGYMVDHPDERSTQSNTKMHGFHY